jgi:inosine-uridine nucleoside N-ribohydrolase
LLEEGSLFYMSQSVRTAKAAPSKARQSAKQVPAKPESKPKVILDCDPGHDDAFAILFASIFTELLGITSVSGNVGLPLTTHNALLISQLLKLDVPVHAGSSGPLIGVAYHAPDIHGKTGLGGPKLPKLKRDVTSNNAVQFIIDTVRHVEDVWLVAVGPLTNIALAIRQAPDIVGRVKGISIMGGSNWSGNRTPAAEFNIYADPEAADVVFSSGVKTLYMSGLNLTHQFRLGMAEVAAIRKLGGEVSVFYADMLEFFLGTYSKRFGILEAPMHDVCALLAITHPEVIHFEPRHVDIELRGEHTRGMTLVDERDFQNERLKQNAQVGLSINRRKGIKLLLDALASFS